MRTLPATTKLYLHVATLRRRVLFQHMGRRLAAGALAIVVLLVGLGLLNVALFLALRAPLGDLGAVLVVAGLHAAGGGLLLWFATREPHTKELDTLAAAEADALEAMSSEAEGVLQLVRSIESRLDQLGSTVSYGATAVTGLADLIAQARKEPPKPAEPQPTDGGPSGQT